jgi:hypothetical protein
MTTCWGEAPSLASCLLGVLAFVAMRADVERWRRGPGEALSAQTPNPCAEKFQAHEEDHHHDDGVVIVPPV